MKKQDLSLNLYYKHYICDTDSDLKHKVILISICQYNNYHLTLLCDIVSFMS